MNKKTMKQGLWDYRKLVLKNFLKKKLVVLGFLITVIMTLIAVFAPWIATADPYATDVMAKLSAPSATHFFGTDQLGRDIFSRVIYGTRISMEVGLSTAFAALVIGLLLGLAAGYEKCWTM